MLREWHDETSLALLTDAEEDEVGDMLSWYSSESGRPTVNEHLMTDQHGDVNQLLEEYSDVFSIKPGSTTLAEHRIETGSAKPARQHPYRLPHAYRETVQKELCEMEAEGIVEPSRSEWASPIVLVPKKDGTLRLCVDYR